MRVIVTVIPSGVRMSETAQSKSGTRGLKPRRLNQYHVFLASPGDVQTERQHVRDFFAHYNRSKARQWKVQFEVIDWENCTTIGVGRPQELITRQTLDKYRESLVLVIGMMWQRFGSPTGVAESGTEEEFNWAMESHRRSGFPEIKWFFRKADKLEMPADPAQLNQAVEQWNKVLAFRKSMQDLNNPVFYKEYPSADKFHEVFDHDLDLWLCDPSRPWVVDDVGPQPPEPTSSLPAPPELYAVPSYILTNNFIGRRSELDTLDAWARSTDPLMVVEGIGGLGKSALTWEWVQQRAAGAIPNLAGRVWWSFYERGTSIADFVLHALAYVRRQDPHVLGKETTHYERCVELVAELKHRPFLLVLDGFERMLTAYHRWDKAQQRDDKIDTELRACVEPRNGEFLRQLLSAGRSKILLSTRLFPSDLQNRAGLRPIPGVAHHNLEGLSEPDALAFFQDASIHGDEKAMLEFAEQFDRHSLLLKVVCGEIAKYPRQPFDFDAWRADPIYGGKLKLSELDLKQRYNHILRFALEGLDEPTRKLLCRIAILSENVGYDTLAALNPFLPPKPKEVREPNNPEKSWRWDRLTDEQKQAGLAEYKQAQEAYHQYHETLRAYPESAEHQQAVRSFDKALRELQDRGLLQWDRDAGHYDMHPVVRGHAAELLEEGDRKQTFLTIRDHFAALPPDDLDTATELSHVANSIEIYRCLIGAGLFDEAVYFYVGDLSNTLLFHVAAHTLIVELLTPLFRGGQNGLPNLRSTRSQSYILSCLAIAVAELGREEEALPLYVKALAIDIEEMNWSGAATDLRSYAAAASNLGRRPESSATVALSLELARAMMTATA
jgi:tetratricopeptide (TPR) repeat protein